MGGIRRSVGLAVSGDNRIRPQDRTPVREVNSQESYLYMNMADIGTQILLLAQQPADAAADGGWQAVLTNPFNFLLIAMLLLWVMVILPQQRQSRDQQKKIAEALAALKKNDHIVTVGGIHGVVVNAASDSSTVTIRIDDASNAKMIINRDAIARVINDSAAPTSANAKS